MHEREITFVQISSSPHAPVKVEAVGGYHLGYPWLMPECVVIYLIKHQIESYFIKVNTQKFPITIGYCEDGECLRPENLLELPEFPAGLVFEVSHLLTMNNIF